MGSTKPEKKEKKEKKRSEADGVTKPAGGKKEKRDKKDKKEKLKHAVNAALDDELQRDAAESSTPVDAAVVAVAADGKAALVPVVGALVPFARPLADDKGTKKIMKCVRKAAKAKTLKRGVKEVVKSLRKAPAAGPGGAPPPGVVVLAGDISPMDVISHIPVLCEDVGAPYVFVASRAELGAAGSTKRPTSVVMVTERRTGGGAGGAKNKKNSENGDGDKIEEDGEEEEDFAEVYKDLSKLVEKEQKQLRV
ncbi:L30e-like protein [Xylariaceae sp. FL0804]|nr:L30e-like protein [Xylariaceae sp. FL0804]